MTDRNNEIYYYSGASWVKRISSGEITTAKYNCLKTVSSASADLTINTFARSTGETDFLYFRLDQSIDTIEKFKKFGEDNNAVIIFPLKPERYITYQLTPQQIEMLLGDNNIWADTRNMGLTYKVNLSQILTTT